MNEQPIEKHITRSNGYLDVVDVFSTIQGEGPFTGHRAIFVRLAGCNLQCPGCDTDYTSKRKTYHDFDLLEEITGIVRPPYLVVITGGEPFRQPICNFANILAGLGYMVQIETNGTFPPSDGLRDDIYIVCSPKTGRMNPTMAERADCFKYVLHADSIAGDGLPIKALDHNVKVQVARPPVNNTRPVYLQPMDSKNIAQNHRNTQAVVESCITHGYQLQLQIHKIIGAE
jgi:7-carboxy-7-deazaguanine synthase